MGFGGVQPTAKASAWPHQDKEPRGIIPLENLSIREVEDSKKPVSAAAGAALVLCLGQGKAGGAAAPQGCPRERQEGPAVVTSTHHGSWVQTLRCPGLVAGHAWGPLGNNHSMSIPLCCIGGGCARGPPAALVLCLVPPSLGSPLEVGAASKRSPPSQNCFELYIPDNKDQVIKACKTEADGRVVEGNHTVYRISAPTPEEKEEWIKCIK